MDSSEPQVHSFIVKLWLESEAGGKGGAVWRGHITHVPGGDRRYFRDLGEIRRFVEPYLAREGAATRGRFRRWLGRLLP
jgi:hypothetical protein